MLTFLKNYGSSVMLGLILLIVIHDHFVIDPKDKPDILSHDISVINLGKTYKKSLDAASLKVITSVTTGKFVTISDLTKAQASSLETETSLAWKPVADALATKFGKAEDPNNTSNIADIQKFYADLLLGMKGW